MFEISAYSIPDIVRLPLVVALIAQISAQAFKVVLYSVTERRFAIDRFVNAAGIPSAHTAFVTALAAAIGLRNGITSDIFAVTFVFAAIVVYDSFRLRGHVQHHAEVLNRLMKPRLDVQTDRDAAKGVVSEHVGHTIPEVAAGIVWGLMWVVGLV
jgi:acid phosphatase family membrane protein YuiD